MATQTARKTFTVQGTIYDAFNEPLPKVTVQVFDKDLRTAQLLGTTETSLDGSYAIVYNRAMFTRAEKETADIFLRVFVDKSLQKEMGKSSIHFNVQENYVLDFKIDGTPYIGLSEFETLAKIVKPLLEGQGVSMKDLNEEDIRFLSAETKIPASIISVLPLAFSTKTKIAPAIYYGLFRLQYPTKLSTLLQVQSESLEKGIKEAIKSNIISKKWEVEIPDILKTFNILASQSILNPKNTDTVDFQVMLKTVISTKTLRKTFIDTHLVTEANPEKFWDELASKPGFTPKIIEDTQNVFRLNSLTSQPLLTAELYKLQKSDSDLKVPRDYTKLTTTDFEKSIKSSGLKTFPPGIEGKTKKQKIANYARLLETQLEELYPTDAFKHRMIQDQDHPFGDAKADLKTFLSKNQDIDLKTTEINQLLKAADFKGIRNKERIKKVVTKVNRVHKIGSDYKNTRAILKAGLGSAFDIVQMPEAAFVNTISSGGNITKIVAKKLHRKAVLIDNRTTALATKIKTEGDIALAAMGVDSEASPDYQSLFGDSNLCDCEHCQSVYSPSAYFVDMLNYMKNNALEAFTELLIRRPDLEHILLTCKNTNTPLPYIDLVNEVLENLIVNLNAPIDASSVPQTNNTSDELAAFPEHVNSEAYVKIREDLSSFQLPLQLHLEETRMYLEKLHCERYELMELFHEKQSSGIYSDINIAAEYLGLSENELHVINGEDETAVANIPTNKVSEFLEHTGLTYVELLRLLECYFINPLLPNNPPKRTIIIEANATVPPDEKTTCDINKLELKGLDDLTIKQMLRFIRLWKKLDWDILDLDRAFTALGIKKEDFDNAVDDLNTGLIIPLSHISRIKNSYTIAIPEILSLWADIPNKTYVDKTKGDRPTIPSFYDSLFKNKKVSNPLDLDFSNPQNLLDTITLASKSSIITPAYNISESDFNMLTSIPLVNGNLTLENLSIIYRYSTLARMLHITIEDVLLLIKITGIDPLGSVTRTTDTFRFIHAVKLIKSSGFSLAALSGLLLKETSDSSTIDIDTITTDVTALRAGLKKIEDLFPAQPLAEEILKKSTAQIACITEFLSNTFGAEAKIIEVMLNDILPLAIAPCIDPLFINSTQTVVEIDAIGEATWAFPDVVNNYLMLYKTWEHLFLLTNTLSISVDEFVFFQNHKTILKLEGIWTLPTNTEVGNHYEAFENLISLLQFREEIEEVQEDWYVLLDPSKSREEFIDSLVSITSLLKEDLKFLLSAEGLNLITAADYLVGKHVLNIYACAKKAEQLGSSCENLEKLTKPEELLDTDALLAKSILKSKYDESTWLAIIKPISNVLREKKRDALVNYLLKATDAETKDFRTENNISDSNDLYTHFLIDNKMAACMMTSRLKQAISSLQLFIDRCLMGLEKETITVTERFASQWNEWRKVYRVWEANRKVFLYPENWIEPDLRDDKSPFFKELEAKLTQNEVTDDIAKDALLEYLEKLDVVANLQIIGFFEDSSRKITHVLGRTKNIPHQYFYRKQEKSVWSAWEKVELDIQGDHILLVVWNNRLMVFWGEFTEKQGENKGSTSPLKLDNQGNFIPDSPQNHLEIKLSWSEYKNEKWLAKKVSEEYVEIWADSLFWKNEIALSSFINNKKLIIRLIAPNTPLFSEPNNTKILVKDMLGAFCFDNCNSSPVIAYADSSIKGLKNFDLRPIENVMRFNMYEIESPPIDSLSIYKTGLYRHQGSNYTKIKIFNNTPGKFQILPNHNEIEKNKPVQFFYNNEQSTFYVQSHQTFFREEFDNAIVATESFQMRSLNEPTPIDVFTNTTGLVSFKINSNQIFDNFPIVVAPPLPVPQPPSSDTNFNKRTYSFQTFYHPFVCNYIKALNTDDIDALYNENLQYDLETLFTTKKYNPDTSNVKKPYPLEEVDFSLSGTYSIYNWELFFHIPLLIASRLSQNQKFEEARKWFHYIFDPTKSIDVTSPLSDGAKRFWITKPFKEQIAAQKMSIEDLIDEEDNETELKIQLRNWEDHPFNSHAVARFRKSAYMRSTVMKYIDNLINWGDQLFRRDSIESINEATLLYVLAANLLGKQPENIPTRAKPVDSSFNTIKAVLNPFSNAKVTIEAFLSPSELNELNTDVPITMPLFCLPKNTKLLGYWDTIADKLFEIRHCMNIDGVVRQLPLFEPPIDPALLVRAKAAGLDLNSVLNDISASLPNYRFQVMLNKANELCNDVKSLGGQLLATLEKKDAEELSLLRSSHEIKLLSLIRDIKKKQIDEVKENLNALNCSKKVIEERKNYYGSRPLKNDKESFHLESLKDAALYQKLQGANQLIASVMAAFPKVHIGAWSWGVTTSGEQLAVISNSIGAFLGAASNYEMTQGNIASVEGGHERREDDWKFQTKTAELELKQIEKQIIAAEIRQAIAEKDLSNHEVQMEQSKKVDDYMRSKFTNAELYNYMITQISGIYFQTYQMAYDIAKKAEKCYEFELGIPSGDIIQFGHWDSLKKGLLSGEKLQFDLRRLEVSYLDNNKREFELTKHISLRRLDPQMLLQLKATGKIEGLTIPEWLFDLDCPGHYKRRIKTIGLSIPCVTGPYTSVNCKLKLHSGEIRINPSIINDEINIDKRSSNINSIVTSSAQNDNGMFEGNLRDERYLPFEGAGIANSVWNLELPQMKQFDYNTISDVILHVSYTALDGGEVFKGEVITDYESKLADTGTKNLHRLLSLEHDFPNEWHTFITNPNDDFVAELKDEHFPYFAQSNKQIKSKELFQINSTGALVPVDKLIDGIDMEIRVENNMEDKKLPTFVIVEYAMTL